MNFLFRADTSAQIGAGHVMRCLALAQALQDSGHNITFVSHDLPSQLEVRLQSEQVEVVPLLTAQPGGLEDAAQLIALAKDCKAEWVVVDGYHFGADYQKAVKDAGLKLLSIDDYGHASDALLHWCQQIFGVQTHVTHRRQPSGFEVRPKRWIVERTFAWLNRFRRLSKDYEQQPVVVEGFIYLAMSHLMLRRLTRCLPFLTNTLSVVSVPFTMQGIVDYDDPSIHSLD